MHTRTVATPLGPITIGHESRDGGEPVVFLHGLFLDRSLWDAYDCELTQRTHITVDMPGHGDNPEVGRLWRQEDCVDALITVLDRLAIPRCIAVGHSWGAVTIVQAAVRQPSRFAALGLCNMPFAQPTGMQKISAHLQKLLAHFPGFYATQVCRAVYSRQLLDVHPEYVTSMRKRLAERSPLELARTIDAVMLQASDLRPVLRQLQIPALAVVGESDHVGPPPGIETRIVPGRHVSPREAPDAVRDAILAVIALATDAD